MDSSFSYRLGRNIYELSKSIDPQFSIDWQEELEPAESSGDEELVSLAYSVVQRRRMPKRALISLLNAVSARSVGKLSEDMPARALLQVFFAKASTKQAQNLLRELGMEVGEDPYLGGISTRSRG
ncbi:hypothetical protein QF205_07065 [Luteimonas composti]|uniref:Uncharacterized protein n=1 Tax=Luteimonas composti TaxID=398257 RepID=A0ABT6MQD0_9GAMM|nr:hypothetical protein [Luteimonas composti]MDH7452842.1 hypothetical protein [Luteimonas composti]